MALTERLVLREMPGSHLVHKVVTKMIKGYISGETAADILNGSPYPPSGTAAEVYRRMSVEGQGFYDAVTEVSDDFRRRHDIPVPSTRLSRGINVAAFAVYGTADLLTKHILRSKIGPVVKPAAKAAHRATHRRIADPRPPVEGGWGSQHYHEG